MKMNKQGDCHDSCKDTIANQLEEYINLYKGKKLKTEEFLHNLQFNLNYIQYKILELQFQLNE